MALISLERRAPAGEKEIKFEISLRSLDGHTHGELTRADQVEIRLVLKLACDEVEDLLVDQNQA